MNTLASLEPFEIVVPVNLFNEKLVAEEEKGPPTAPSGEKRKPNHRNRAPEHGGDELFVSGRCLLLFGARGQRGHVDVSQSQRVSVADGGGAKPRRRPVDRRGVIHLLQGNLKMRWMLSC